MNADRMRVRRTTILRQASTSSLVRGILGCWYGAKSKIRAKLMKQITHKRKWFLLNSGCRNHRKITSKITEKIKQS